MDDVLEGEIGFAGTATNAGKTAVPNWIVTLADLLTYGQKGKAVTYLAVQENLVKNPTTFKQIYTQHASVLNSYFGQIDLHKLNSQLGSRGAPTMQAITKAIGMYSIPSLIIGFAGGYFISKIL